MAKRGRNQEHTENCRRALQRIADLVLPTKDPFLKPRACYEEGFDGFAVYVDFVHHGLVNIFDLKSARAAPEDLQELKAGMIKDIRERLDAWEKE